MARLLPSLPALPNMKQIAQGKEVSQTYQCPDKHTVRGRSKNVRVSASTCQCKIAVASVSIVPEAVETTCSSLITREVVF